jgi:trk system potassium uptake protein TrkA
MRIRSYVVAGCGQVGAGLARALALEGHEVSVIDPDPEQLQRLGPNFRGRQFPDSPLDREVLVQAGIESCDGLAAVFHWDATNVAIAMAARRLFRVPSVVARLDHPVLSESYHRLGIQTLCPQQWGVHRLVQMLSHSPFEVVTSLGGPIDLVQVHLPLTLVGRGIEDLAIPQEIQVILVTRGGQTLMAQPGLRFQAGDVLQVMVRGSGLEPLRAMLQ